MSNLSQGKVRVTQGYKADVMLAETMSPCSQVVIPSCHFSPSKMNWDSELVSTVCM